MSENKVVLSLQNVTKKFGKLTVLDDMSLDVHEHEIVVLCGPSGGGKSTLLRTINGLEKIDSGKIYYRDELITNKNIKEVRAYFEDEGADIAGMSNADLAEAEEVFAIPDGRYLIVEA